MSAKKYFFAVGNFENALQRKPNDLATKILYLESLCLICSSDDLLCKEAKAFLNQILNEHPDNKEIQSIKEKHFK